MDWTAYWVWLAAALVLMILEMIAPVQILLGFAISAGVVGGLLWFDGAVAAYLAGSLPMTLVVFAA